MTDTPAPATMADHWWWRPGWRPGRRFYTWHITFAASTDVHRLAADYRQALADVPGLDLVPDQWLHLTMQGLGFTDEVSETDARAIADAAIRRLAKLPAFDLVLGPAITTPEALLLTARPAEPVHAVRLALRSAITDVWPTAPEPADGFRPHVSVAYSNTAGPARPASDALAGVTSHPVTARITAAELIVLGRDRHMYEWDTYAHASLG
ncbi:2'-5' RNA ligase family protein [Streptomyces sp. BE20]|uniref:2'-5' RNA ligase family protein n=1 Tax=Streptomyces sp. BE20 TaxID=3002525 RepID=UPI002E7987E3|nr:2'-5' RNA ligase family protein [Streptomyces sp. BE20]MEE1820829.1 2'-5' RNA ligase family protein [Streptomyces sp. BE20]